MPKNKVQTELRIKFKDGEIRKIGLLGVNDGPRIFLEKETGLTCGPGDLYAQAVGLIFCWISNHGPDDESADSFRAAAMLLMAQALSEKYAGYMAEDTEHCEFLVYVPTTDGHLVIMINKLLNKILQDGDWSFTEEMFEVTILGKKLSTDELRGQLKSAIDEENYELAAKLRDKLNKRKK
jgi:hypothetical protein